MQAAMHRQQQRSKKSNSMLSNNEIKIICQLNPESKEIIKKAIERLNLSARSFYRISKVARTIADLEGAENIDTIHLTEALGFRARMNLPC